MSHPDLDSLAEAVGHRLLERGLALVTAESCTGGWIAKTLTDVAGSSQWFDRGMVTYSNRAKEEMLDVPAEVLAEYGAVSEQVALAMAQGALRRSRAQVAVAVTGIAGPDGGSGDKPVGTVWIGWQWPTGHAEAVRHTFSGGRESVRRHAVKAALEGILERVSGLE